MVMIPQVNGNGLGKQTMGDRAVESWNRFWFSPSDPTVLALIRVCCGLITLYTALAYSLDLQEFFGRDAWWNLEFADRVRRERPYWVEYLRGHDVAAAPATDFQNTYFASYPALFSCAYPP